MPSIEKLELNYYKLLVKTSSKLKDIWNELNYHGNYEKSGNMIDELIRNLDEEIYK
ncbi:hypothetical protein [Spiroplasma endosymbiont of Colias croceus]|uniref:hypothetical protein n=1 Tax=Spiroplasma endosymbiont of Colias croceus TaxID=3066310 RepID=UPI0030D5A36C